VVGESLIPLDEKGKAGKARRGNGFFQKEEK